MNQKNIEEKWQKIWKEKKVFKPVIDKSKEKFFITVAYPYANSVMHIGHGRTFTMADIIARFQRLNGKNVLYPMGFHISGTPVLAVADGIAKCDEKQIKMTRDAISDYIKDEKEQDKLLETFKEPYKIAEFFSGKIEETFDKIGLSIDWSRQFSTGDDIYKKFIEWQYKKLYDLGILVQGKYPILYSVADKNAVGEDDIKDGDLDKVSVQEMTYILFKLENENKYLPATTLRPDALFGTTNMWINPEMKLIEAQVEEKIWIVAKEAFVKLEHQYENVKSIKEFLGKELIGKNAITPLINRIVPIAAASFIDENHGTGMVYSSPAGAPHDYMALIDAKKEGIISKSIDVINTVETIDKKGNKIIYNGSCPAEDKIKKFNVLNGNDTDKLELAKQELYKEEHYGGKLNENAGEFKGIPIKIAKDKVKEKLIELGLGGTFYETSRRAITRGNDKVIVANLEGQWFLNYKEDHIKEKAYKFLDNCEYLPEKLKEAQRGYIKWVEMRPCARKRGIGTPLPYDESWIIEPLSDSTIYQMLYLIHHIIVKENIKPEQLSLEVFDYVMLGQGNIVMVAEENKISKNILEEMRKEVEYWQSLDARYTNQGHMSNHLSFLIYHYALIFPQKNWSKNITIGGYLIKDGAKISKSKGNGIPLMRMKDVYGVDIYRFYIAIGANYDVEMDFRDDDIFQLQKKFNKWKELMNESISKPLKNYDDFSQINKWLISKFYSRTKIYFEHFENMRIREAYVGIIYEFMSDITYHERRTNYDETLDVLRFIAKDYALLMTPVTPHTCEELFEKLGEKNFASLTAFVTDPNKYINKEAEDIEGIIENLITGISRIKETKNLKKINKIVIVQATDERFAMFDKLRLLLEKTRDFKTIFTELMKEFANDQKFMQKFVPKTLGEGLSTYLSKDEEKKLFEKVNSFIEKEFNSKVEIKDAKKVEGIANIVPGKPGIILE